MKQQERTKKRTGKQSTHSMEDWIAALKTAAASHEYYQISSDAHDLLSGRHHWYPTSHARPTYCNVCREALSGVTSHGLSCEVCKCKVHKRCASKAISNCKWTTLASVGKDIIEDKDGIISMPHQWMEGNLPVSAKCAVCDKTCGSVLRLQDWRCLWCKATVHTACRPNYLECCPLGPSRVSVVPPTALHSIGSDEAWEAVRPQGCSPLLVFVNSKSGDNQGVKFLRRFKQLLNPAQVFDLIATGPGLGLRLFRHFDPFRILVCSGDGSVGWVLSEIDRLSMQKQCQVGVLPLGTGNDLARVLGWGSSCDDDTHLPQLLDKYEKASTKILDRWSIMTFERSIPMGSSAKLTLSTGVGADRVSGDLLHPGTMAAYEDSVVTHLTKILQSDQHSIIISSAKVLCETIKDFSIRAADTSLGQGDKEFSTKCQILKEKLDMLLCTLQDEELALVQPKPQEEPDDEEEEEEKSKKEEKQEKEEIIYLKYGEREKRRPRKEQLMLRANSLKRAVRQLVEHTEKMVDEQNKQRTTTNTSSSSTTTLKMDTLKVSEPTLTHSPSLTRLTSISPLPDIRRDSACEDYNLESLPVPVQFADTRRSSATEDSGSGMSEGEDRRPSITPPHVSPVSIAVEVLAGPDSREGEEEEKLPVETLEETTVPDSSKHFKRIETPEVSLDEEENAEISEILQTESPLPGDKEEEGKVEDEDKDKDEGKVEDEDKDKDEGKVEDEDKDKDEGKVEDENKDKDEGKVEDEDKDKDEGKVEDEDKDKDEGKVEDEDKDKDEGKVEDEDKDEDEGKDEDEDNDEFEFESQDILSGLKMSEELANICHIDSSETSDDSPEGSTTVQSKKDALRKRSVSEDRGGIKGRRLGKVSGRYTEPADIDIDATNLISTSPEEDEEEDDFRIELGLIPETKKCSIAHFVEGFDIARRSIKCRHRKLQGFDSDQDIAAEETVTTKSETKKFLDVPIIQIQSSEEELNIETEEKLSNRSLLDVVKIRIQGSNRNLTSSTEDTTYLSDDTFDEAHRKSLTLSETDYEELIRLHKLSQPEEPVSEGPTVVVDPPSPPPETVEEKTDEDPDLRRFSYDYSRKLSAASPCSLLHCSPGQSRRISSVSLLRSDSTEQPAPSGLSADSRTAPSTAKRLPIINPLVRLPMWPNVSGAGLISQALLANADALCAAAVPLMDPDETLMEGFYERCVMNNYFGIGIDAKISLDFHHKREEHPEKCRSRAKNYMWYGVLGSKEWLQKTYKNLEQRVQLECDGQRIPLPSLQGIVILNIPSFMGGTNFWGGTKEDDIFLAPSVDDKILEVVAVFGSVQMAASRLINLQHHRIAQCQTVQINILGDEGVPIQVDGEAWIQPPGMIRIIHKNRMKMLCRNRALENSLRAWEEKQRHHQHESKRISTPPEREITFSEEELQLLIGFIDAATTLIKCVKLLIIRHPSIKVDLYELADRCATNLEKVHPSGKILQGSELRPQVTELVSSTRELHEESCVLLREKGPNLRIRDELENQLSCALGNMEMEFRKCQVAIATETGQTLVYLQQPPTGDEQERKGGRGSRGLFWSKFRREKAGGNVSGTGVAGVAGNSGLGGAAGCSSRERGTREVASWGVAEVGAWLESLQLSEYADAFSRHDVRGRELLTLTRRDLKDLGITKVGHVKRILQAVKELSM